MASISNAGFPDSLLKARLEDAVQLCRHQSCPRFVGFLDERQYILAQSVLRHVPEAFFFGGHRDAERVMAGIFPDFMVPDESFFPIIPIAFTYRPETALTHRDFLGTLLSCGIKREKIGDILCGEGLAVAFVQEELVAFICDQIGKVGGEGVRIESPYHGELPQAHHFKELRETIASPRLDAVVKALTGLSREGAAQLIQAGLVSLNHVSNDNVSASVKEKDILSIRGRGRFRIDSIGPLTRKGRLCLQASQYI